MANHIERFERIYNTLSAQNVTMIGDPSDNNSAGSIDVAGELGAGELYDMVLVGTTKFETIDGRKCAGYLMLKTFSPDKQTSAVDSDYFNIEQQPDGSLAYIHSREFITTATDATNDECNITDLTTPIPEHNAKIALNSALVFMEDAIALHAAGGHGAND